ncbi:DUF1707 domain-containing protein [Halostreptopolyspora alba]|uniref:DUF1707 domain-containing protein n=1 Tax=Halostreptopolyspora alba TaxID=2487137 RepID=A0A3N0E7P5_9ACTN|nr:DUF1707 domain-containing protein [Nocardiopsaceae bacterium YIM 96095]
MSESSPQMRVSDAERERVAAMLRDHFEQGRLDDDEFNARLESAYEARTRGDLEPLTGDLPERDLAHVPVEAQRPATSGNGAITALRGAWGAWVGVNAVCLAIWLVTYLTGVGTAYPWFLWVAGPWGVVLLCGSIGLAARGGNSGTRTR